MYDGITFMCGNEDGDQVVTASIILKFVDFAFTSIKDAPPFIEKAGEPWLENYAMDERIKSLEAAKAADDVKIEALEKKIGALESQLKDGQ